MFHGTGAGEKGSVRRESPRAGAEVTGRAGAVRPGPLPGAALTGAGGRDPVRAGVVSVEALGFRSPRRG